jgi:hypothetical protein
MKRYSHWLLATASAALFASPSAMAKPPAVQAVPGGKVTIPAVDMVSRRAERQVDVWVTLDQDALANTRATLARSTGVRLQRVKDRAAGRAASTEPQNIRSAMQRQRSDIRARQQEIGQRLRALGGRELGRVTVAYNAIAVRMPAARLAEARAIPGVRSVTPVVHFELDLSETVPYVGASAVQAAGIDGSGVTVAVLDSGIDFTHRNFSGPGTVDFYQTCYAQRDAVPSGDCANYFGPTAPKVTGGFDFVGESWPNADRTEDPNPIDFQGHGTNVADIVAGRSTDGTHVGVAPGAKLMAVKVCSAVSSSCNGVALLRGMDYALDPNGDGDLSDAVDVINMSLGASYGQVENALVGASANAVDLGVVVVASAGNSADKPYVTGSPSMTPGVISVAQTQVPSAQSIPLVVDSPAAIAGVYGNTATLDWAPVGAGVTGNIKTALQGGAADNLACAPLPAGSLSGSVALIDRGVCSISLKVDNAAKAGATGFLLALNAPGDAVPFSFGGGDTFVPSLVIQQSLGNAIKSQLTAGETVGVTISPANAIALAGSMVSSSSRGPSMGLSQIKPDIGAPGASLSAQVGTGDGQRIFGGTSGAAPMVAGAAALMLQAQPTLNPLQVKAMLMNRAETEVYTNPALLPGGLAPITRIGGGELRVDRSIGAQALAWSPEGLAASLSFGAVEATAPMTLQRTLRVENLSASSKRFRISPSFRYDDDAATGAVRVIVPPFVNVPAGGSVDVPVRMVIVPGRLPDWTLNGGSLGGNGAALNGPEYDGYLTLSNASETLTVPWQVLPRKAANSSARLQQDGSTGTLTVRNFAAAAGAFDVFSLLASSPEGGLVPAPGVGDGYALVDLKAFGARLVGTNLQFAMSTHGRRSHPLYPGGFEVDLDVNGDGSVDYFVFQQELNGFGATGQSAVFVQAVGAPSASAFFFTDADLNSGNVIFTVPLSALGGLSPATTLTLDLLAFDNYFTGTLTDVMSGLKFTPESPRFGVATPGGVAVRGAPVALPVSIGAADPGVSSETGLMLMYRSNAGNEVQELLVP